MDAIAKQSQVVDILKGLLPIIVVVYHTSLGVESCLDSPSSFLRAVFCVMGQVAVPMFFMISGYYFFTKLSVWNWNIWGQKMKKRMKTLLLPYVLWIVIDFFAKFVFGILSSEIPGFDFSSLKDFFVNSGGFRIFYDRPIQDWDCSVLGYRIPSGKPIDGPLWYIRDLIIVMCLAPAIWAYLKQSNNLGLILLAVMYVLFVGIPLSGFSIIALFFFSVGAAFSMNGKTFMLVFKHYNLLSYALSAVLLVALLFLSSKTSDVLAGVLQRLFVIAASVALINIADALYERGVIHPVQLLVNSSFFVYASHAVLITEFANYFLWHILPFENEPVFLAKVFLRPLVAWSICIGLFLIFKKLAPRTLNVLTGHRN